MYISLPLQLFFASRHPLQHFQNYSSSCYIRLSGLKRIMLFEYYIFATLFQLGVLAIVLPITINEKPVTLEEQKDNSYGSSWTGMIPLPLKGFKSSVDECQILAGKVAQAVVQAVEADELARRTGVTNDDEVMAKARRRNFGRTGKLLFSVHMNSYSKYAFVSSVPRSDAAKQMAWNRIRNEAPLLDRAIEKLDNPSPDEEAQLHAEEVAYSLFEANRKSVDLNPFSLAEAAGSRKRPADTAQRGYGANSFVGSWLIKRDGPPNGASEPACKPNRNDGSNIYDKKDRAACLVISNELGVQTTDSGSASVAGSDEQNPKRKKPNDGCGDRQSTGVAPRAKACPFPLNGKKKPSPSEVTIGEPKNSGKQVVSPKSVISGKYKPTATVKPGVSREPSLKPVSTKKTDMEEWHEASQRTTMRIIVTKSKTNTLAANKTKEPHLPNTKKVPAKATAARWRNENKI